MSFLPRLIGSVLLLAAVGPVQADTIILTDDSRFEGRLIQETDSEYVFEIQVTPSIKDERRIPKSEVRTIQKPEASETAFDAIRKAVPIRENASVDEYDAVLDNLILPFLEAHPRSEHAADVKKIHAALTKERNVIAGGGIKIGNSVHSGADRRANAYDIDAILIFNRLKDQAGRGAYTAALRDFELMERDYPGSASFPEAVSFALKLLTSYRQSVQADFEQVQRRQEERQIGLERLPPGERERSAGLIEEENAAYLAALERDKALTKWPALSPHHAEPMQRTLTTVDSELTRLRDLDLGTLPQAGKAFRDAWRAAGSGTPEELDQAMTALKSANVPERYLITIEERSRQSRAQPAPNPTPSTIEGTPESPGDEKADDETEGDEDAGENGTGTPGSSD